MAFNTNPGEQTFVASAGQTIFNFNFKIFSNTDLRVFRTPDGQDPNDVNDLLTLNTDYTVSINGDLGGTITLTSGATVNDTIVLIRSLPRTRTVSFVTNGDLAAETLNDDQEYQTYLIIDNNVSISRAVRLPQSATGVSTLLPSVRPNAYLIWNSDGTALENDETIPDAVNQSATNATNAANSATAAASSATSAANSATAAANSEANINPSNIVHTDGSGLPNEISDVVPPSIFTDSSAVLFDGDYSLANTPDFDETSDTTTANYTVGQFIYQSTSGILYECIANSTSGTLLTNTSFFTAVTSNQLTLNSGVFVYTNGFNENGYNLTSENITTATQIDFSGAQNGENWVYKIEASGAFGFSQYRPSLNGLYNKTSASDNRPVFIDGKWFNTTGAELVVNGTFDTDLASWTLGGSTPPIWDNGRARLTAGATVSNMFQTMTTVIGETYIATVDITSGTGNNYRLRIFDGAGTGGTVLATMDSSTTTSATASLTFTATSTAITLQIVELNTTTGQIIYVDNASLFVEQPTQGTEIGVISWFKFPFMVNSGTAQVELNETYGSIPLSELVVNSLVVQNRSFLSSVNFSNLPEADPFINGELWNDNGTPRLSSGA